MLSTCWLCCMLSAGLMSAGLMSAGLMLSLWQYLGEATSPAVKERIKRLLYSWKVGLPQEPKVNEAYLMLKREGELSGRDITDEASAEVQLHCSQAHVCFLDMLAAWMLWLLSFLWVLDYEV